MVNTGPYSLSDETITFYSKGRAPRLEWGNPAAVRLASAFSTLPFGLGVFRGYGPMSCGEVLEPATKGLRWYNDTAKNIKNNKSNPFPGNFNGAILVQRKIAVLRRQISRHFTSILVHSFTEDGFRSWGQGFEFQQLFAWSFGENVLIYPATAAVTETDPPPFEQCEDMSHADTVYHHQSQTGRR